MQTMKHLNKKILLFDETLSTSGSAAERGSLSRHDFLSCKVILNTAPMAYLINSLVKRVEVSMVQESSFYFEFKIRLWYFMREETL